MAVTRPDHQPCLSCGAEALVPAWQAYPLGPPGSPRQPPAALQAQAHSTGGDLPYPTCHCFLHLAPSSHPVPWATTSPLLP